MESIEDLDEKLTFSGCSRSLSIVKEKVKSALKHNCRRIVIKTVQSQLEANKSLTVKLVGYGLVAWLCLAVLFGTYKLMMLGSALFAMIAVIVCIVLLAVIVLAYMTFIGDDIFVDDVTKMLLRVFSRSAVLENVILDSEDIDLLRKWTKASSDGKLDLKIPGTLLHHYCSGMSDESASNIQKDLVIVLEEV